MLAVAAREARRTQAGERVDTIHAGATIEAGALCAVGRVVLTVDPTKACGAGACVAGHTVGAVGAITTGVAGTLVDVLFAEGTLEAREAVAEGHVDAVCAGATVVTWVRPAVVDVRLAVAPRVARLAMAAVAAVGVLAGGTVAARALHTLVDVDLTGLPLPARGADAGKALIVLRCLAFATVSAGARGTWGQHHLTSGSGVGQQAVALVTGHIIDTRALVQTWVGCALINVGLAVGATEAFPAGAHVAAGHVPAGAAIDAGVRLTLVVVNVAVGPTPPRVTVTLIPIEAVPAGPVNAGVAVALVDL